MECDLGSSFSFCLRSHSARPFPFVYGRAGEKRAAPRRLRVPPAISLALFLSSGRSSTGEGGEPVNRRTAVCSSRCRATSSRLYLPAATFISTSKVRIPLLFSSGSSGDGVGSGEVRRRRGPCCKQRNCLLVGVCWFFLGCPTRIFCWVLAIG
ncbi:hypothetical protein SETIT_1G240100v2 [Setaria italica]|uniref:Uncharacterized protein n=1 Tax=Setaria italica TaxID=4555 RepID=A0A368PNR0_SETIT|nr:hypothetical protein SETIT_1G240100v2 [Setaria italica]